eukprot:TRINITY_DN70779_c0_g1_i1.p1 TRINITY_DN70779_c0_g1~~TRINITY_DN70779_c0_g1_i1.p1  ORF type:complete len:1022 (+),score=191.97 TRINITY_DN70779_c0_g1_i1:71-3067(+)
MPQGVAASASPPPAAARREGIGDEMDLMQALTEMDAYSVLPSQPLGDYLRGIVEMLREHSGRVLQLSSLAHEIREDLSRVQKALGIDGSTPQEDIIAEPIVARIQSLEVHLHEYKVRNRKRRQPLAQLLGGATALMLRYFDQLRGFCALRRARREEESRRRRIERLRKLMVGQTAKGMQRVYLHKATEWLQERRRQEEAVVVRERRRRQLECALGGCDTGLRRVYHRKCVAWLGMQDLGRADRQRRAVGMLLMGGNLSMRRVYHRRALQWLERAQAERQRAEVRERRLRLGQAFQASTADGLRRLYLGKAVALVADRARAAQRCSIKMRTLSYLSGRCSRALLMFRWELLREYAKRRREARRLQRVERDQRKRRREAARALCSGTENGVRRVYLTRWVARALERRKRRKRLRFATELAKRSGCVFARRVWNILLANVPKRTESDELRDDLAEQRSSFEALREYCDTLGAQLDVNTSSLETNSTVLTKVVDRLISVDEQLEALEDEKVSHKQLSVVIGELELRAQGDSADAGSEHGSVDRGLVTASSARGTFETRLASIRQATAGRRKRGEDGDQQVTRVISLQTLETQDDDADVRPRGSASVGPRALAESRRLGDDLNESRALELSARDKPQTPTLALPHILSVDLSAEDERVSGQDETGPQGLTAEAARARTQDERRALSMRAESRRVGAADEDRQLVLAESSRAGAPSEARPMSMRAESRRAGRLDEDRLMSLRAESRRIGSTLAEGKSSRSLADMRPGASRAHNELITAKSILLETSRLGAPSEIARAGTAASGLQRGGREAEPSGALTGNELAAADEHTPFDARELTRPMRSPSALRGPGRAAEAPGSTPPLGPSRAADAPSSRTPPPGLSRAANAPAIRRSLSRPGDTADSYTWAPGPGRVDSKHLSPRRLNPPRPPLEGLLDAAAHGGSPRHRSPLRMHDAGGIEETLMRARMRRERFGATASGYQRHIPPDVGPSPLPRPAATSPGGWRVT